MKKILLSLLFFAAAFTMQAQDKKPTKEETQRFLNSMLQNVIGSEHAMAKINIQSFNNGFDEYVFSEILEGNNKYYDKTEMSLIRWENLLARMDCDSTSIQSRVFVRLFFSSQLKKISSSSHSKTEETFTENLVFYIPHGKFESVKKAVMRLSELAKEETKDPFAN